MWGKYCSCISGEVSQFMRVMGTCSPSAPLHAFWGRITVIQSCACCLLPLVLPAPPLCPWPPLGGGKKIKMMWHKGGRDRVGTGNRCRSWHLGFILWRGLEWRAAYLGRGPGETVILQHGSPRHWVNATSWGRRRLDGTCNGQLVPRVMGTRDRHNTRGVVQMEGLMAIGGGYLGQAQSHGQRAQGVGLVPWMMGTPERPDLGGHMGQD